MASRERPTLTERVQAIAVGVTLAGTLYHAWNAYDLTAQVRERLRDETYVATPSIFQMAEAYGRRSVVFKDSAR